jgi:hypothetical protein
MNSDEFSWARVFEARGMLEIELSKMGFKLKVGEMKAPDKDQKIDFSKAFPTVKEVFGFPVEPVDQKRFDAWLATQKGVIQGAQ